MEEASKRDRQEYKDENDEEIKEESKLENEAKSEQWVTLLNLIM
jgi:hypothetical protein